MKNIDQNIWNIAEIATALNIPEDAQYQGDYDDFANLANITGVSIDSRTIKSGELFIALKGDNFDGHKFLNIAQEKGASLAIVEKYNKNIPILQIIVKNCYLALNQLAIFRRKQTSAKIIAITGSVGKTSCKSALYNILQKYGKSYASIGNYNNHIGMPLSLANMAEDAEFAVFELGMNHSGEIAELVKILKPHIAWITVVNDAHSGNFNHESEIVAAKAEIFSQLVKSDHIILNNSDKNYQQLREIAVKTYDHNPKMIKTYGNDPNGDLFISDIILNKKQEFEVNLSINSKQYVVTFNIYNISLIKSLLAIILILDVLQLDYRKSWDDFRNIIPVAGRGNIVDIANNIKVINDAYNANPASMRAALNNLNILGKIYNARTVAIIGTMLELGSAAKEKHLSLLTDIKNNKIDKVITVGEYMDDLHNILPDNIKLAHFKTVKNNVTAIIKELEAGDIVLIKASNSIGLEQILHNF